jgi:hypothetical protein
MDHKCKRNLIDTATTLVVEFKKMPIFKHRQETQSVHNQPESSLPKSRLETENNLQLLDYLFRLDAENLGKMPIKQKIKQEFKSKLSLFNPYNQLRNLLIQVAHYKFTQMKRFDLKPVDNVQDLLANLNNFIPLEPDYYFDIYKLEAKKFDDKKLGIHLHPGEKVNLALKISFFDYSTFVVERIVASETTIKNIPASINGENYVYIVGTSLKGQPTGIIIYVAGKHKRLSGINIDDFQDLATHKDLYPGLANI